MNYLSIYTVTPEGIVVRDDNKVMTQYDRGQGYKHVCLKCDDGKFRCFYVHRLVGEKYCPNPENYPVVQHMDDDPSNNHYTNLVWGTQSDNIRGGVERGRVNPPDTSKTYHLQSPDGQYVVVHNLKQFCLENNLDPSGMSKMYRGSEGRNQHKGWKKYPKYTVDTSP